CDEDGEIISYEEFHPYGTTSWWAQDSSIQVSLKRYRYTGMERDEETGMQMHGVRGYMPWLGRWERVDPAGLIDGGNRWAYVRGNPVGLADPIGLQSVQPGETLVEAGLRAKVGQWLGIGAALTASAGDVVNLIQAPPIYTSTEHRVLAFGLSSVDASGMLQSVSNEMLALGTKASPEGTEAGVAIGVFAPAALSGLDLAGPAVKLVRELDELGEVVLDAAKQGSEEGADLVEAGLKHDLSAGKFLVSRGVLSGLDDLARFRRELGLAEGEGTLARLDVGGQSFYGINAHGQPVSMSVNAITRTHAEADAFQQAINAGASGTTATLYVDRALCSSCGTFEGVRGMARQLGLESIEVVTSSGTQVITP
ncbi:MAG: hypothetical protein LDL44_20125, partial [Caenispirillum sp.]|nr:hypothetical protein [Caenispirillum sp.]